MKRLQLVTLGLIALAVTILGTAWIAPSPAHAQEVSRPVVDVGVVVSDLDRSVAFYREVLGMTTTSRSFDLDAEFGRRSGLTDARGFHIEALKFEDSENATEWKLMSFEDAQQQDNEHIHDHTGMRYVTIHVTSLDPFLERIRAHDVNLLGETPISLGDGNHFVLIQDPDGVFIELIGPLEGE